MTERHAGGQYTRHRRRALWISSLVLLLVLACQVVPTPPPLKPTPRSWITEAARAPRPASTDSATPVAALPIRAATQAPGDLAPFPYQAERPFAEVGLAAWQPADLAPQAEVTLPVVLEQIANRGVVAGLTMRQRAFLAQNGFVVLHSQEAQFSTIRQRVADRFGQPYYLTSDAASHALYLTLAILLQAVEREELHRRMQAMVQATLEQTQTYLPLAQGGPLEADTRLAAAYLGVALALFDPHFQLDSSLVEPVTAQVAQIMAADGEAESVLIPGYRDDFSIYQPGAHYAGDPALEAYYRGMTWLSRATFYLNERFPGDRPSLAPLILTLALRQASTNNGPADQEWAQVYEVLSFFNGPARPGDPFAPGDPATYAVLMDRAYGRGATVLSLLDQKNWDLFRLFAAELPQRPTHPATAWTAQSNLPILGWRWMNVGFRPDRFAFDNLIYPAAGSAETPRQLPSGLDFMAVLGSPAAGRTLERAGETHYLHYTEQATRLQENLAQLSQAGWSSTMHNAWASIYQQQMRKKAGGFPIPMRTVAWEMKDLNSALGNWAQVLHSPSTIPIQAGATPGNQNPVSAPALAYVEPNPPVFYRLAHLANVAASGLTQREMTGLFSAQADPAGLNRLIVETLDLGDRLGRLGDIAASELAGNTPGKTDQALILAPLGLAEQQAVMQPPMAVIASLDGAQGRSLQVANGRVDRIYVVIPWEGKLYIAQGGVYSYYEFPQPRSGALSDAAWRQTLVNSPPDPPSWARELYLPDGNPVDVLAFRIGDTYHTTPAAGKLNVRQEPGRFSKIVYALRPGEYLQIIDGPTASGGDTWWKIRLVWLTGQPIEGWVIENQEWFERAWGQ
jgi:hypothetical protein